MANLEDCTIHMQQLAGMLQIAADDHTREALERLSENEHETYIFANNIRDLLKKFQGMEKHFDTSKDPLNLHAYEDELREIQRMGENLCEDKLSPMTIDKLPLTEELQLDKISADDLWSLQNKLSMLAEELQNVARRNTNKMADKTAWHYQSSIINAEASKNKDGLAAAAVRNQRTGG